MFFSPCSIIILTDHPCPPSSSLATLDPAPAPSPLLDAPDPATVAELAAMIGAHSDDHRYPFAFGYLASWVHATADAMRHGDREGAAHAIVEAMAVLEAMDVLANRD